MSFFGPTLAQLGADPNSPSVVGSDGTLSTDTSGGGSFLNTLGGFLSIVGTTVGSTYRSVSTPTGPVALAPGQSYLLPSGSQVPASNIFNPGLSSILMIILVGIAIAVAIRVFGSRR